MIKRLENLDIWSRIKLEYDYIPYPLRYFT